MACWNQAIDSGDEEIDPRVAMSKMSSGQFNQLQPGSNRAQERARLLVGAVGRAVVLPGSILLRAMSAKRRSERAARDSADWLHSLVETGLQNRVTWTCRLSLLTESIRHATLCSLYRPSDARGRNIYFDKQHPDESREHEFKTVDTPLPMS
jgi:hypothetical protein